jgi:hypothetical protein
VKEGFYKPPRPSMRIFRIVVLFIVFTSLAPMIPSVQAETTSITDLQHPASVAAGDAEPLSVSATVSYRDAKPSYLLVVGILSTGNLPRIIPGIASSSPDRCVNQPILAALCDIQIGGPSGVEHVEFKIGGILGDPQGVGSWNLNITAALVTANNTIVTNSGSSIPFSITIAPMILTVEVPANVSVSVDGAMQPPGPAQIPVSAGSHNITLPITAQVNDTVRLRFDSWSDGFGVPNRTVTLRASKTFEAIYVTQYRLTIAGQPNLATGEGWYDPGSTVTISVPESEPMSGILGLLGGKLRFQAWYEGSKLLTNSSIDIISMEKPHTLTVVWQYDYTIPIVIILATVTVLTLASVLVYRRTRPRTKHRTRSTGPGSGGRRRTRPKVSSIWPADYYVNARKQS